MRIFCIIPALNEEKTIGEVVKKVKPLVDEIVLVDDGSSDRTAQIATEFGAVILRHPLNRGQGAALETGNQYALKNGADIIFHFDADGQFSTEDISTVLAPLLSSESDAVLGSRFLGKESNMPAFKKKVIMPIARLVNNVLLGVELSGLTDPQCGFRAMTSSAWRKISIKQGGMAHTSEIISKIIRNKIKVKEVPITVTYHRAGQGFFGGRGTGSGGIRVVKDLLLAKLMD
ncbi:MAG: glycosyltransferase family 2 protein [Patescibacteria group bacterium]|jgi:glycosyltransferase involved in cell wall biosynthesis